MCQQLEKGLKEIEPKAVKAATAQYRLAMDTLADFFDECCEFGEFRRVPVKDMRGQYEQWCKDNGENYPVSRQQFNEKLRGKNCEDKKTRHHGKSVMCWNGVDLKVDEL